MKHFTDTEKWNDPWFMKLPLEYKTAWQFLWDNCDRAGVWDRNDELANFQIGSQVNWADFREALDKRIQELPNGKWWVVEYVGFQYGKLKATAPVHRAIIEKLRLHGLWDVDGIRMGLESHKEEDIKKEEVKDQGGGCKGEAAIPSLDEVKAHAQIIGLVEWKAVDFFEKHQTTGWIERGEKMLRWQSALNRTKTYWEAEGRPMTPPARGGGGETGKAGRTVWEIKSLIEVKEKAARALKAKHFKEGGLRGGEYCEPAWTSPQASSECDQLRQEIKTLNDQLSKKT